MASLKGGDRGAELVELALAMPVLLLMMAGIVDMGMLLNRQAILVNAAREGARVAALQGWTEQEVTDRVHAFVTAGGISADEVVVTTNQVAVAAGSRSVAAMEVIVSYPYTYMVLGPLMAAFGDGGADGPVTLSATATMRMEVAAG